MAKTYSEKLRDPRWQKKRLEIMQRDGWACRKCFSRTKTLNVHHYFYRRGLEPWEYGDDALLTVCEDCHAAEHGRIDIPEGDTVSELRAARLELIRAQAANDPSREQEAIRLMRVRFSRALER